MAESKFKMKVAFNTGANYGPSGQRIAVWVRTLERASHDVCCLVDFDRNICCIFPIRLCSAINGPTDLCTHAMHMYQWGQYDLCCPLPDRLDVLEDIRKVLKAGYDTYAQTHDVSVIVGRWANPALAR